MAKTDKLGCGHPRMERRSRSGLIDAVMFRFGRYPWSCRQCGRKLYTRNRHPFSPGTRMHSSREREGKAPAHLG